MSKTIKITFTYVLDRDVTPEVLAAIETTASVMDVQTEDGFYSGGYKEAEAYDDDMNEVENVHLADVESGSCAVEVIEETL